MMREEDYRTKRKYLPKFKPPPSGCKLIFNEDVKEKVLRTFFHYLRNNGGSLPMKFSFIAYGYFLEFKFKECRAREENGILIISPLYKGEILSDEDIEDLILDLVEGLRRETS